ncbi:MAG: porphobilinogen synthase [Planctomycetia bacterium]|nr:porphobilinogen synthase [Planctomycetia bacterium]
MQNFLGHFPQVRMRRLRQNPIIRKMVQAYHLRPEQLILPLFIREGRGVKHEISSMPGIYQMSLDILAEEVRCVESLGIGGVLLFGIPEKKDEMGSDALSSRGIIARGIETVKKNAPNLLCVTDLCFCEYTSHGHCGCLTEIAGRTDVDNDATLKMIQQQALVHARAGADLLAPSGMMDGMISAMRTALDAEGFSHLPIMSYAVKYAGSFYGPFRDAAESAPQSGDRRSYQMDPAALSETALRETALDLAEGADIVMVKPALAYLDILRLVREHFPGVPLAAYNVSGEYSMVKAAAQRGWLDEKSVVMESLLGMSRAGAGILITYWAKNVAEWI